MLDKKLTSTQTKVVISHLLQENPSNIQSYGWHVLFKDTIILYESKCKKAYQQKHDYYFLIMDWDRKRGYPTYKAMSAGVIPKEVFEDYETWKSLDDESRLKVPVNIHQYIKAGISIEGVSQYTVLRFLDDLYPGEFKVQGMDEEVLIENVVSGDILIEDAPTTEGTEKTWDNFTQREYAAIHLGVPESGTKWLDEMIVNSKKY